MTTTPPLAESKLTSSVADCTDNPTTICSRIVQNTLQHVEVFYRNHPEIQPSHGIDHIRAVYNHALNAVKVHHSPTLSCDETMMVLVASLLHDVDDNKYFPNNDKYENATTIMNQVQVQVGGNLLGEGDGDDVGERDDTTTTTTTRSMTMTITPSQQETILQLISFVSCSKNKNSVPPQVILLHHQQQSNNSSSNKNAGYWMLIPRWADRLEAVGRRGVVRCYQYNRERLTEPLCSPTHSPRPQTLEEVWMYAHPDRFENYNGHSTDMISHYYDKLLHVSRPPPDIVRNSYLQEKAVESSQPLIEVCLRYGRTGIVDEDYIQSLGT